MQGSPSITKKKGLFDEESDEDVAIFGMTKKTIPASTFHIIVYADMSHEIFGPGDNFCTFIKYHLAMCSITMHAYPVVSNIWHVAVLLVYTYKYKENL